MVSPRRVLLRWGQERKNEKKGESTSSPLALSVLSIKILSCGSFPLTEWTATLPVLASLDSRIFQYPFRNNQAPALHLFPFRQHRVSSSRSRAFIGGLAIENSLAICYRAVAAAQRVTRALKVPNRRTRRRSLCEP